MSFLDRKIHYPPQKQKWTYKKKETTSKQGASGLDFSKEGGVLKEGLQRKKSMQGKGAGREGDLERKQKTLWRKTKRGGKKKKCSREHHRGGGNAMKKQGEKTRRESSRALQQEQ